MELNMYIEKIIDVETGTVTEREYTAKEIAEVEAAKKTAEDAVAAHNERAAKKSELLKKLGITEDEAKLLLG
jgi:hypothetical protein